MKRRFEQLPSAFPTRQASVIVRGLVDEAAAIEAAHEIARETRRCVTVRDTKMAIIATITAPSIH